MTQSSEGVTVITTQQLAQVLKLRAPSVLLIDSRSFLEYNDGHILGSVNVNCSKIVKRRLQQEKVTIRDFLLHTCHLEIEAGSDAIVYDQSTVSPQQVATDSFLHVLLDKLQPLFRRVVLLEGGFLEFRSSFRDLCEDKSKKCPTLTSLSQPCMPVGNIGLTRILTFLYLGSQQDAHDKRLCQDHSITYHLNVSTNCPKPDFISDGHFLRLSVQDSYGEKLLPHFKKAIQFIDKAREANGCILVHCLAGISRSPTVAVAFVMKHLGLPFDEAFRYVKSKRPSISPNFNFLGQLLEWERQLQSERGLEYPIQVTSAPIVPKRPTSLRGLPHTISLSMGLKTPLETVFDSSESSPSGDSPLARTPLEASRTDFPRPALSDLSPTTQLSNLTFENFGERFFSKAGAGKFEREKHGFSFKGPAVRFSEPAKFFESPKFEAPKFHEPKFCDSPKFPEPKFCQPTKFESKFCETGKFEPKLCEPGKFEPKFCESPRFSEPTKFEDDDNPSLLLSHRRSSETCTHTFSIRFSDGNEKKYESKSSHTEVSISRRRFEDGDLKRTSPPTVNVEKKRQAMSDRYARSDSATTSGLGSEISDVSMETSSVCGSGVSTQESDDGVFLEVTTRRRPRPCSLLGLTPTREFQPMSFDPVSPAGSRIPDSPFTPSLSGAFTPSLPNQGRKRTELKFDFEKPSTSQVSVLETMPERPEEPVVAPPRRRRSGRGKRRVDESVAGVTSEKTTPIGPAPEGKERGHAGVVGDENEFPLHRVQSCPGIVDSDDTPQPTVQRRSRPSNGQKNRYSCGSLDQQRTYTTRSDSPRTGYGSNSSLVSIIHVS